MTVLDAMYSPDSETQFLSYATNLLLEMTSRSPDYNREMFEQPLSQCKFQVCSADVIYAHPTRQLGIRTPPFLLSVYLDTCGDHGEWCGSPKIGPWSSEQNEKALLYTLFV